MKTITRLFTLAACSFLLAELAMGLPTPPAGKQWVAVSNLTDEFNSSSLDSSKWHKTLWNYGVPVQMRAENSGVANGNLWIKATLDEGAERWFETSRVMSNTRIRFPVYTECSMKTAHISAYNTFWLNNGDINTRDEIDICENNSNPSIASHQSYRPYTMYSQYFIVENGNEERNHGNFDNRNLSASNPLQGVKWNEAYHTLGAWWKDKNNIQFYLDGEPAGSVVTTKDFTLDQNIIWDLWTIDATWSGGIANQADLLDDNINTMYVDWIHTYELVDATYTGTPVFAWTQMAGRDMMMQVTNGPPAGAFDLLSSTNLLDPVESWTASQSGLLFDGAGEATVTNPASENQEFFRIGDSSSIFAMFDWEETTDSGLVKWNTGYNYTETDNGVTMVHGGRSTTGDGQPYAIKFAYGAAVHDYKPGTFTMEYGGNVVNFKVTSIDISQASGTDAGSTKYVRGMLGTTVQWEIVVPENGTISTYTAAAGNMSLEIDTIEWHAGWIDGGGAGLESTIDNLSITVVTP